MVIAFEMKREKAEFIKKYLENYAQIESDDDKSDFVIMKLLIRDGVILKLLFEIGELYATKKINNP